MIMSGGKPEDWDKTKEQIERRKPQSVNWLRHSIGSEAALIDEMLLDAAHTKEDIARKLMERFPSDKSLASMIGRVSSHFNHLQTHWNGTMPPHLLKLKEDANGRWSFDLSGDRPQDDKKHSE